MKKIALLSVFVILSSLSAKAFVDNQYMTTAQYMQNTGYSAEMQNMMNVTNQDPYREPYAEAKGKKNMAKKIYSYLVPGTYNNLYFYNHNGNFDNPSWSDL